MVKNKMNHCGSPVICQSIQYNEFAAAQKVAEKHCGV